MPSKDKRHNAALAARARAAKSAPAQPFSAPKRRKGERLLLKPEVLDRVALSYPAIWGKMVAGTFPRSVALGARIAWYESEIDAWLASLKRAKLKGDEA
jgi:prophage regulatory protein